MLAGIAVLMLGAAMSAAWVPMRRVLTLDPNRVLRADYPGSTRVGSGSRSVRASVRSGGPGNLLPYADRWLTTRRNAMACGSRATEPRSESRALRSNKERPARQAPAGKLEILREKMEAPPGFEPGDGGFADFAKSWILLTGLVLWSRIMARFPWYLGVICLEFVSR